MEIIVSKVFLGNFWDMIGFFVRMVLMKIDKGKVLSILVFVDIMDEVEEGNLEFDV